MTKQMVWNERERENKVGYENMKLYGGMKRN
jgi:hypothetical protein